MSKPQVFQFKVPDGVKPGEEIKMKFPGREERVVICLPAGAKPGMVIQFNVPEEGQKAQGEGIGAAVGNAVQSGENESIYAAKRIQATLRGKSARKLALSRMNTQGELVTDKAVTFDQNDRSESGSSVSMFMIAGIVAAAAYFAFQQGLLNDMLVSPPPPPLPVARAKFLGIF